MRSRLRRERLAGNPNFQVIGDEVADSPAEIHGMRGMQHGQQATICRARARTSRCSARWTSTARAPDRVADVTAYGNYAYLSVRDPEGCTDAGFAVIDITDPTDPKQVGFIDSTDGSFPGEGAHVINLNTEFFKGQILAGNNEVCDRGDGQRRSVDLGRDQPARLAVRSRLHGG